LKRRHRVGKLRLRNENHQLFCNKKRQKRSAEEDREERDVGRVVQERIRPSLLQVRRNTEANLRKGIVDISDGGVVQE
jgi:hypothetical protein